MNIISHRGVWTAIAEKNTRDAFIRSFQSGFGTETDIRDFDGQIVISHDIPHGSELNLESFFRLYQTFGKGLPLALNIKSDGLQVELAKYLRQNGIANYFVFDMSIPDTIGYLKNNLHYFIRQSEFEVVADCHSLLYANAAGVWLDELYESWINPDILLSHLANGKRVCIVSPEIHGRDYLDKWRQYKKATKNWAADKLMLCTDLPELARKFFSENLYPIANRR
ncbi:hypothetical protein SPACI_051470 [Sporomusa acidovorans DSM 3132]|uniref:Phosphodiesterase n=2 Tax=Sporomusa TaxID=2375 RepID=A0ABZ3JA77_SPOA4|nr:hypothetical protein SPACI_50600 [Sporomusa acidovorans DSM 3132]SDF43867.1 hypothetical protein SAMN04488499_104918 [Sporomusa acidovorans]